MRKFIDVRIACLEGLRIISDGIAQRQLHRMTAMEFNWKQQEHLNICTTCNPELEQSMIDALWPGAKVSQE